MKSVTNSKRSPFQVKRYGHDDGLRSSSVSSSVACGTTPAAGAAAAGSSAWTMPAGHRTRTTSADVRVPRPKTISLGDGDGHALDVSSFCRRLPARNSILRADRAAGADLARQADAQRCQLVFRRRSSATTRLWRPAPPVTRVTRSVSPSPSMSAAASQVAPPIDGSGPGRGRRRRQRRRASPRRDGLAPAPPDAEPPQLDRSGRGHRGEIRAGHRRRDRRSAPP